MKKGFLRKILLFVVLLTLSVIVSGVKADMSNGSTVNYTMKTHGDIVDGKSIETTIFYSGKYEGTCVDPLIEADRNGKAVVNRISNSNLTAKMAYYIEKTNLLHNNNSHTCGPNHYTNAWFAKNIMQLSHVSYSTWKDAMEEAQFSSSSISCIYGKYNDLISSDSFKKMTVPSGAEVYFANPTSGAQDFVLWYFPSFDATKSYASGSKGVGGAQVNVGEEITYQIKWSGGNGTVTITDTLGNGLEFSSVPSGCTTSGQKMTCTSSNASGTITYKAKVKSSAAGTSVCNSAIAKSGSEAKNLKKLCNPVPEYKASKIYASDTPNGKNNSSVKVGDVIKYSINYKNGADSSSVVVVTDTLSKGLEYVASSSSLGEPTITKNSDGTTKLVWNRNLAAKASESITYSAKVTNDADLYKVCNTAKVKIGNNNDYSLIPLCNPLPKKEYGGTGLNDNPGWIHNTVKVGDSVKYKIALANVKNVEQKVIVTDILSKGLTYNGDIKVENGTIIATSEPVVDSSTKQTTLTWTIIIPAGQTAVLNYSAKVNDEAVNKVINNASAIYDGDSLIKLAELENPIVEVDIVKIPDTASSVAIIGIVAGVLLIGLGGYVIYTQYKKS